MPCEKSGPLMDVTETTDQGEEAQEAKMNKYGVRPTDEEVDKHNATHLPFRSWCPFCVAGKAKNEPHWVQEKDRPSGVNVVSLDYMFMGDQEGLTGIAEDQGSEDEDDNDEETSKKMPILVMRCRHTKYIFASVVPRKGNHPYTVKRVGQDIAFCRLVVHYVRVS